MLHLLTDRSRDPLLKTKVVCSKFISSENTLCFNTESLHKLQWTCINSAVQTANGFDKKLFDIGKVKHEPTE